VEAGLAVVPSHRRPGRIARVGRAAHRLTLVWPAINARIRLRSVTSMGRRVTLRGRPAVINEGRITMGDRVRLVSTVARLELAAATREIPNFFKQSIHAGELIQKVKLCVTGKQFSVFALAVNLERVADSAIPTQDGMKNVIEVAQFQVVRHRH